MEDTKKHNNTNFINRKNQESINHRFYISKVDTSNKKINNIISNKNAPKLYKKEVILFQKPKTTTETLFKQSTLEKPKNNIKSSVSEQIKNLELENNELKKKISNKSDVIKIVQSKCNEQNKIIYELTKKIQKLKIYIDKNKLKQNAEKIEEEMAIAAVEEQIMKDLCPNNNNEVFEKIMNEKNNDNSNVKFLIEKIPQIKYSVEKNGINNQCYICFDLFQENEYLKQLNCGHIFHKECLSQWILNQKNCPICNKIF